VGGDRGDGKTRCRKIADHLETEKSNGVKGNVIKGGESKSGGKWKRADGNKRIWGTVKAGVNMVEIS